MYQDVHVMIFIGFGFLMTFIRSMQLSAIIFNWVASVFALQWAILSLGFWHQVIHDRDNITKIDLKIDYLVAGDFGAASAMITFGAVLGKINLQQLLFLVFWMMIFYGLNEAICIVKFGLQDIGGSITIHTYGAYYGLAASFFFQPTRAT